MCSSLELVLFTSGIALTCLLRYFPGLQVCSCRCELLVGLLFIACAFVFMLAVLVLTLWRIE